MADTKEQATKEAPDLWEGVITAEEAEKMQRLQGVAEAAQLLVAVGLALQDYKSAAEAALEAVKAVAGVGDVAAGIDGRIIENLQKELATLKGEKCAACTCDQADCEALRLEVKALKSERDVAVARLNESERIHREIAEGLKGLRSQVANLAKF